MMIDVHDLLQNAEVTMADFDDCDDCDFYNNNIEEEEEEECSECGNYVDYGSLCDECAAGSPPFILGGHR